MDISIIMLACNRPVLMQRAIECALAQKNINFEFILVDKAIDHETHEICLQYKNKYPQIKYVNIPPGNIGIGRNAGIEVAQGDYITFIDDDDYFEDDMMEFLLVNAKKHHADISICGCYMDFNGKIKDYYVYDEEYTFDKIQGVIELLKRQKYNSANPCKLFKKSLFENVRYPNEAILDDVHTVYKLFANANKVYVSGMPKYYFLKHSDNYSGYIENNHYSNALLMEYMKAFKLRTEYLSSIIPSQADYFRYTECSYVLSMANKIISKEIIGCELAFNRMKKFLIKNKAEILLFTELTCLELQTLNLITR